MSTIADRLMNDIKTAMKAGEKETLVALRSLHAKIKDATVNVGKEITDGDVLTVIGKAIKQGLDSATQFRQAGREELAAKEDREIAIYRAYQPEPLDEATLIALIDKAIAETGATSKKEMGKVMALLMPETKGRADGAQVSRLVGERLP